MTNGACSPETEIAVFIGLGSNIGDREDNLREAIARIKKLGLEIVRASSVYETEPVGYKDQPWFLNQVIMTTVNDVLVSECRPVLGDRETTATIQGEALLSELLNIERAMGRQRTVAQGPRVIDLDLLLFGDRIIAHSKQNEEWSYIDRTDIFVPHPRMHDRRFVLEPLCEIAPDVVHPILEKTCRELLSALDDPSTVRLYRKR
jgi:7,8-dihydro-6-hydroxymethylpterin-pyrophosphokinase